MTFAGIMFGVALTLVVVMLLLVIGFALLVRDDDTDEE